MSNSSLGWNFIPASGHAVDATEITPISERDAEIGHLPAVGIECVAWGAAGRRAYRSRLGTDGWIGLDLDELHVAGISYEYGSQHQSIQALTMHYYSIIAREFEQSTSRENDLVGAVLNSADIRALIDSDPPLFTDFADLDTQVQANGFDLTHRRCQAVSWGWDDRSRQCRSGAAGPRPGRGR